MADGFKEALEQTGAWMMACTDADDGHSWVRHSKGLGPALEDIEWCQHCGVHKIEVPDWGDNPQCPAIAAIRKVLTPA